MHCDEVNRLLFELDELDSSMAEQVKQHAIGCKRCQSDLEAINSWRHLATEWQDEAVPNWQLPRQQKPTAIELFRQWFPTAASTAALCLVGLMYVQQDVSRDVLEQPSVAQSSVTQGSSKQPVALSNPKQNADVERILASSRAQREQELQALMQILKAEMDQQAFETEESLRYVISHQIQGRQEVDELSRRVNVMLNRNRPQEEIIR